MMEKPCAKEDIITQPSVVRTCNGDDDYILELTEDEMQQIFQSIDDIMGPENTDVETDAFLQDFEEFERSYLPACGTEDASIDASILEDFDVFEKTMLPPISHSNMDNVVNDGIVSINCGAGKEEHMKEMVNEIADNGNETNNFIEEEDDDDMMTLFFDDNDFGGGGMDQFQAPPGGTERVHYIKCSRWRQPENEIRKRKKVKRKYRGIIETEEQTAKRLEITKIKNREAATRTYERRKEYAACLEGQVQKLQLKNKYLKNSIKFLECQKREDMKLQPLRRTLSGSMLSISPFRIEK